MGLQIEDGHGSGYSLKVSGVGQAHTVSESHEMQHHISRYNQMVYRVHSIDPGITAKTQTILHLRNNDTAHNLVVSSIHMQAITSTASKPVVGEYFSLGFDSTVASGGTEATPVNLNRLSGLVASVTVTGVDPTMSGTFLEVDRTYHSANGTEYTFEEHSSIILGLNNTLEIQFTSTGTGEAECCLTFMMIPNNED